MIHHHYNPSTWTLPACPLIRPITQPDVLRHCIQKWAQPKGTGTDSIPAEFITKARTATTGSIMVDIVTRMCNLVLQLGYMPQEWKYKAITPLHKAGPRNDANNYRPIAVSTTLYRIFTAIFAARLTTFMQNERPPSRLLDSQFAFRKQLSTQHAHMVLTTCRL